MSVSLAHKVPISLGGLHSWADCALAHLGCNLLKGKRLISEAQEFQLLLPEAAAVDAGVDDDIF